MDNPHIGSSFDGFLDEHGILAETEATALRRVLAWRIERVRNEHRLAGAELAARMGLSQSLLDHLLGPGDTQLELAGICDAIAALDRALVTDLV